jgi:hypothetical protein
MQVNEPNNTPRQHLDTRGTRCKRGLATFGVLLLIAMPATGLVLALVDKVQESGDATT